MLKILCVVPIAIETLVMSTTRAPVDVPLVRSPAVTIDARLDSAEWAQASVQRLPDGTTLRFQHDGKHLFIAVAAAHSGFPSFCTTHGDTVRVLHASAALGSVVYQRRGDSWTTGDTTYTYGMRNAELSREAQEERRVYLAQHRWLASTFRMSGTVHEMQISLDLLDRTPRLALGYFVAGTGDNWSIETWPPTMTDHDDCVNSRLVRGYLRPQFTFKSEGWAELVLER